ncbi:DUF558-domain-containing protein [Saitoella complicata NRRL Y-17804]|uniref:DUF558-domain-containing protein n=1 Tax=Saitoella complicata (strain BCRC 22490 / CBS 7301 / JCM 7358 / NBRC 10748 / NRRL Y-17804) TaxID=698492 RepID=UPI000867E399|nr:DUF558-domain-containing protein [Saitoella complicata NRRL Y-17804]ODQ50957.1 DUF558-domain-containing protein [Saitoella complicata NRRL Y-17804]
MNLILLLPEDLSPDSTTATLIDSRRCNHIHTVLHPSPGFTIQVGLLNDKICTATVLSCSPKVVELRLPSRDDSAAWRNPPKKLPFTLVLALPRPKVLDRVVLAAASLGVKSLILIPAWRVEKSYWGSPKTQPARLREQVLLGLEQACDTVEMTIEKVERFAPWVRSWTDKPQGRRFFAHVEGGRECPYNILSANSDGDNLTQEDEGEGVVAVIGPEGGWVPSEVDALTEAGFDCVGLGPRILRTETAVACLVGRMF